MAPPSAPTPAAAWRTRHPALTGAGLSGILANLLVLGAPLYAVPMYDSLRQDRDGTGSLILALLALGLFAAHTLLDLAASRRAGTGAGPARALDGLWIPVQILVLGLIHPYLGAMALAGVAAFGALVAAGELAAPSAWEGGEGAAAPWPGAPDGVLPNHALQAGLRFCGVVYLALIVGTGAALLLHGALSPGLFAGAALIASGTMRAALRTAWAWLGTQPAAKPA